MHIAGRGPCPPAPPRPTRFRPGLRRPLAASDDTMTTTTRTILDEIVDSKRREVDAARRRMPLEELEAQSLEAPPVRDFLDRVFDGASDSLLLHLASDNKLTEKQRRTAGRAVILATVSRAGVRPSRIISNARTPSSLREDGCTSAL